MQCNFGEKSTDRDEFKHEPPKRGLIGPRLDHTSILLKRRFNSIIKSMGLFSGQQELILFLLNHDGATVSNCAKYLDVSNATVSISVKRLEKGGFLYKERGKSDARITNLYLTEKGKKIPEEIREKMDAQEKYITKGMTKEEIILLSDLLDKASKNLKEAVEND